jgi:hypothetical protein
MLHCRISQTDIWKYLQNIFRNGNYIIIVKLKTILQVPVQYNWTILSSRIYFTLNKLIHFTFQHFNTPQFNYQRQV